MEKKAFPNSHVHLYKSNFFSPFSSFSDSLLKSLIFIYFEVDGRLIPIAIKQNQVTKQFNLLNFCLILV